MTVNIRALVPTHMLEYPEDEFNKIADDDKVFDKKMKFY